MPEPYRVLITNMLGQVLERDGTLYRNGCGHPVFHPEFPDFASAREFSQIVVQEHPHAECVISGDNLYLRHFDANWRRNEACRVRQMFRDHQRHNRAQTPVRRKRLRLVMGLTVFGLI
ncbi:MAG: hypothetical protein ACRC8S_10990 [Fimbriiglobus sp.]